MFLGMQGNQFMAAGKRTQAQAIADILHLDNVAGAFHGYKPMNKESIIASQADYIVVISHDTAHSDDVVSRFAYTKAAKNKNIILMESSELLGFGPRLPAALKQLSEKIYPQL